MLTTRLPSKANHSKLSNQGEAVARLSCYVFPKMSKRNISTNGVFSPTSRFLIASIFVAAPVALLLVISPIVNLPVFPAAAQTPQIQSDPRLGRNPALVSPDRIAEVSTLTPDRDNFPELDNFAWRAFVAMNWPALTDPINRGLPDRNKVLSDAGPRVWETFKSRYELFQVDSDGKPVAPQPWATYDAVTPCGTDSNDGLKTLASFDPFMDFNQASNAGTPSSPLVAQNGTYTRYETRLNEEEYGALSRWSHGEDLPNTDNPVQIPAGSIAVKAAWRLLTAADTPAVRARYYVVQNANVVDVAKTIAARHVVCSKSDVALVGLHIVIRTLHRPQGIWATFEHVDNVPPAGPNEPDAKKAGMPYSYFDASKPELGLWPKPGSIGTFPVSLGHPPKLDPEPNQVVRQHPIHLSTLATNRYYWSLKGIKGTVWANYMLVAVQWPSRALPVDPYNDGVFFPEKLKENLANTTMETYSQDAPTSCMSCHQRFNLRGRNFVGLLGSFR